jgi:hypothetical protein
MRIDNVLIVVLGLIALGFAAYVIARWGGLPIRPAGPAEDQSPNSPSGPEPISRVDRAVDAIQSFVAVLAAGAAAGWLVGGGLGRLMMRVLGATSGDGAQGVLTEAEETVGEITFSGTFAFMVFVGAGAGMAVALVYLVARPWLPGPAALGGLVAGVLVLGLLGPADALSPENTDFVILEPAWVAVVMIVVAALIVGATVGSLAVRFDRLSHSRSRWRYLLYLSLVFLLFLPLALGAVLYVAGRTFLPGALDRLLDRRHLRVAG